MEGQICDPARSPGIVALRQRGFVLPNTRRAGAARTGRGSSTERRIVIHCYALLFFVVFHCYSRGRERRAKARKAARHKAKFAAGSNAHIVIALLLTMPRCGSAAQGARCRSGQDAGQHPRPVRRCPLHDVKQPGPRTRGNASCLRAPRGTVGPRDRLRKTTSNANLLSIITLRSQ